MVALQKQCYDAGVIEFFPSRAVAVSLLGFQVHWYGIMYLLAFVLALILLPHLQRYRKLYLSRDEWSTLAAWAVVGVILGGRLGFVFFYDTEYYRQFPLHVLYVWQGGMSFHGGFLGTCLALTFHALRMNYPAARLADVIVVPAAIGLALGRLGNFINQELYGTVTNLPWGMTFDGAEGLRHPTQLYAMVKDLLIAGLCYLHLRRVNLQTPGKTFALFLVLYGFGRILVDPLREQTYSLIRFGDFVLTRGQLLTLPLLAFGALLWLWLSTQTTQSEAKSS